MFMIAIEREYFDAVRGNFGLDHVDVATGVFTADISLGQIVNLFQHVMEEEALATQAYLDSIASVLITYLLKSRDLSEEFGESGRLSAVQLQRVVTYVERHLSKTISLRELAETAGLSLHHFATAFRKTTGGTPHRYVVDRKIAYARMLLADRHITIPDVAARLGFASQSHFTQQFRRSTGTTPGRYRRNLR
jgi:AraC family transcriptional regulator